MNTSPWKLVCSMAAASLILTSLAACGGRSTDKPRTFERAKFNAANFVDPRTATNEWFPLTPGTQWVREGTTLIGNRAVPHEVITTVTDVIRVIDGVKTVLVHDYSVGAGQVVQQSLDYFALDKGANVWNLGSTTEQYEAGRFVAVDEAWLSGADGAKPGIQVPANPMAKTPPWFIAQPPGEDGDAAEFLRMQKKECVPYSCFDNVLVIREGKRSALDNEFKYFGRGVGQIRNEPRGSSRHADIERLINVTKLSPAGLAEADAAALKIDRRAAKELPKLFAGVTAGRTP